MSYRNIRAYWAVRKQVYTSLHLLGINSILRAAHRKNLLVLVYHDILPSEFDRNNPLYGMSLTDVDLQLQLEWIAKKYNVVALPEVIEWIEGNRELPSNPVLITFDDGHQNNLTYAAPVLSKLGMSAVFFVLSDFIGECRMSWVEEAFVRMMWGETDLVELWHLKLPLITQQDRLEACGQFFDLCRILSARRLNSILADLREKLPLSVDFNAMSERFQFLTEHDIAKLTAMGFEIGSHGKSHCILQTVSDEVSLAELHESKKKLEGVTGRPVRAFAYPFGDPDFDFSGREITIAEKCGYEVAFSAGPGLAQRENSRFVLPRIGVGAGFTWREFEAFTAGTIQSIKRLIPE